MLGLLRIGMEFSVFSRALDCNENKNCKILQLSDLAFPSFEGSCFRLRCLQELTPDDSAFKRHLQIKHSEQHIMQASLIT